MMPRVFGPKMPFPRTKGQFTPNRSRIVGDHGVIELTDRFDKTIAEALVSIEDLPRVLARGRWHTHRGDTTTYCYHAFRRDGLNRHEKLHRFLTDAPPTLHVDHANGNGLDNRQENLRLVTPGENAQNRGEKDARSPKSGHRNVYWDKARGCWFVSIIVDGKTTRHGSYQTIEDAAAAAAAARRALHTHCPENSALEVSR